MPSAEISEQEYYDLGFLSGQGNNDNYKHAMDLLQLAAACEPEDFCEWLSASAKNGSLFAMVLLARILWKQNTVENGPRIIELLSAAHLGGMIPATHMLAYCSEMGIGNGGLKEASELFHRAGRAGYLPSIEHIATSIYAESWPEHRRQESLPWLKKGASLGSSSCARLLSIAYSEGVGVVPSEASALFWLQRAASLGDDGAEAELELRRNLGA